MQIFNDIRKLVTFLSNFVVPNKTLRVSPIFPLFQNICVVQIVASTVFVETVLYWSSLNDVFGDHYILHLVSR